MPPKPARPPGRRLPVAGPATRAASALRQHLTQHAFDLVVVAPNRSPWFTLAGTSGSRPTAVAPWSPPRSVKQRATAERPVEADGGRRILGTLGPDTRLRWSFSDISPTALIWRNEEAHGENGRWELRLEFSAVRSEVTG